MSEESSASINDVRALVAERLQFDEWLTALEARREKTPEHVFERVHGDYQARRATVMEQLHGFVPELERLLADLDLRATSLASRSQAEEDERAEAMLRHAVGEYDDAKWDETRQRVESTLATLSGEADAIEAQRSDLGSLLNSARPVSAAEVEETTVLSDATVQDDASNRRPESDTAEWLGVLTPAASVAGEADIDSDSNTNTDGRDSATSDDATDSTPAGEAVVGDVAEGKAPGGESAGSSGDDPEGSSLLSDDDLELNTEMPAPPPSSGAERTRIWGTPARGSAAAGAASSPRDGRSTHDRDSEDVFGDARSSDEGRASTESTASRDAAGRGGGKPEAEFDELAFLRSVIEPESDKPSLPRSPSKSEDQKTLRCTECSTMNLPTEWYCERCGGELAAF